MTTETRSFGPEMFFSFDQATYWIEGHLMDFDPEYFLIKELEIKLMPSGGYRAAVIFERKK